MNVLLKNDNWSLFVCLNLLRIFGFLVPGPHSPLMKSFLNFYRFFWFIFIIGIYVIAQIGDLVQIWGNLPFMVSSSFLLFTNLAFAGKLVVVGWRSEAIQRIIDEADREMTDEDTEEGRVIIKYCHRETAILLAMYVGLSGTTVLGWAASAEKNSLPLRACFHSMYRIELFYSFIICIDIIEVVSTLGYSFTRYPYDAYKYPAYEITYAHQCIAVIFGACLNVSLDIMMTTLMALCRCRLKLSALALRSLCNGIEMTEHLLTPNQEVLIKGRLRVCAIRHQAALRSANEIQTNFTEPILGQFVVSIFIICVTAYQLAVEVHVTDRNVVRVVAMLAYLLCMMQQVFIYCYQGNQLSIESSEMAYAAYQCRWYSCSTSFRRSLLLVMVRSQRIAKLTAGGFTTLSLESFTSIIKASYTFFTVLQQVENRKA